MAKNLTSRLRKIFRPMTNESTGKTTPEENDMMNNAEQTAHEALSDQHNPDLGTPEQPESKAPLNETELLRKEAAEWRDKYLRLAADFDNFRKRSLKERSEYLAGAAADTIRELLPVMDDFDRAMKANESLEDVSVIKEGFVLIHQKLYRKLEAKGLTPIDAKGKPFDTDFHEAITQIPAPTEDLKGKVLEEVEKGYLLNDRVIRFSKVVIGQ